METRTGELYLERSDHFAFMESGVLYVWGGCQVRKYRCIGNKLYKINYYKNARGDNEIKGSNMRAIKLYLFRNYLP